MSSVMMPQSQKKDPLGDVAKLTQFAAFIPGGQAIAAGGAAAGALGGNKEAQQPQAIQGGKDAMARRAESMQPAATPAQAIDDAASAAQRLPPEMQRQVMPTIVDAQQASRRRMY